MSAANTPFEIMPSEDDPNRKTKDQYVSFDIPLDPSKPDGLKASTKFKILDLCKIEDILYFLSRLDDLIIALNVPEGISRFRLVPTLFGHDHKKTWSKVVNRFAPQDKDCSQKNFEKCIEAFLLTKMDSDISLDLKEWLHATKKPRSMSVADFVERLCHLNNLIEYCPAPDPNQPNQQTPVLTDPELVIILKNACLKSWSVTQVEANLKTMLLQQQEAYFTGLRKVEPKKTENDSIPSTRNRRRKNDNSNDGSNPSPPNQNANSDRKYCLIHGWCLHSTEECKVIQDQRTQYNSSRNSDKSKTCRVQIKSEHINTITQDDDQSQASFHKDSEPEITSLYKEMNNGSG